MLAGAHGQPLDELVGEDVKQHARTKRVVGAVIGGLSVLLVLLAYLRQADDMMLVWLWDVYGPMTLSDTRDGNLPRLIALSLSQSGAFDQYRRLDRFEYRPQARTYLHRLQGTVRGTGGS